MSSLIIWNTSSVIMPAICLLQYFSEGENEAWYYSTKVQVDELLARLDQNKWESDLARVIREMRSEIEKHMQITEKLTNENKGAKKSAIELEVGKLNDSL